MNFSPVLQHRFSGVQHPPVAWSPNGTSVALAQQSRIIIRDCSDLSVRVNFVTKLDSIDQLIWSPDSSLVGAANFSTGIVQILSVNEKGDWTAVIREGSAGLEHIWFTPDNRNVVTCARFQVKLTLWSLCSSTVRCIKYPKSVQTVKFSEDGNFFTAVEQIEGLSWVGVYKRSSDWNLMAKIRTDCSDLADLEICPRSQNLAVWNNVREPLVQVFNIHSGKAVFTRPGNLGGSVLNRATWTPCGRILVLALGEDVVLVSSLNWDIISTLSTNYSQISRIGSRFGKCVVFEEREVEVVHTDEKIVQDWIDRKRFEYTEIKSREISFPGDLSNTSSISADILMFKTDGLYLAFVTRKQSQVVWIWSLQNVNLAAILVHRHPVQFISWDPNGSDKQGRSKLIILTRNSSSIYFWSPYGALCSLVPDMGDGRLQSATWNPNGKMFAIQTSSLLTLCKVN